MEAEGFRGHSDGHAVGTDIHRFIGDLGRLERLRQGKAQISSAADGLFDVSIHAIDSAGHMGVSGILHYLRTGPERPYQVLEFFFEFDPSQLPKPVHSAHAL